MAPLDMASFSFFSFAICCDNSRAISFLVFFFLISHAIGTLDRMDSKSLARTTFSTLGFSTIVALSMVIGSCCNPNKSLILLC